MLIKLKGQKELSKKLAGLAKECPLIAKAAIYRVLEIRVMTPSKQFFVPVRDGHLRNSGVVVPDPDPNTVKVTLGFGGPAGTGTNTQDVGYAVVQHENLDFAHTVGEAKYLEKPLMMAIPDLAKWIAEDMLPKVEKQVK